MLTLKSTAAFLAIPTLAACGMGDQGSAVQSHADANACEVFVDKALVNYGGHAMTEAVLFVKILPERLDGAVQKAGFRRLSRESTHF